jgi:uncharacterized ferredoxin-like protein
MLYSTRQTARKLGIDGRSLSRYIAAKKVPAPKVQKIGEIKVRLWSEEDIEKVRKLLPRIANGRKTRYQKQQTKRRPKL